MLSKSWQTHDTRHVIQIGKHVVTVDLRAEIALGFVALVQTLDGEETFQLQLIIMAIHLKYAKVNMPEIPLSYSGGSWFISCAKAQIHSNFLESCPGIKPSEIGLIVRR